jgi:hypothetical protein
LIHGYAPASTGSQSEAGQVAASKKAGAGKVIREVAQGDKTDRAKLRRLLDQPDAGDVMIVARDWWTCRRPAYANSSSRALASCRTGVSKPSVNQL